MDCKEKKWIAELAALFPAFRYMKPPVNNVPELYKRYPSGYERGTMAYVISENLFYAYIPSTLTAKARWEPMATVPVPVVPIDIYDYRLEGVDMVHVRLTAPATRPVDTDSFYLWKTSSADADGFPERIPVREVIENPDGIRYTLKIDNPKDNWGMRFIGS